MSEKPNVPMKGCEEMEKQILLTSSELSMVRIALNCRIDHLKDLTESIKKNGYKRL